MYYSHNNNVKCVDSTVKCIGFESSHYVINLNVISSFLVCIDVLLVEINEIIYLQKKKKNLGYIIFLFSHALQF